MVISVVTCLLKIYFDYGKSVYEEPLGPIVPYPNAIL